MAVARLTEYKPKLSLCEAIGSVHSTAETTRHVHL